MESMKPADNLFGTLFFVALLAGCSGGSQSSTLAPSGLTGTGERSWMAPQAKSNHLIYVSNGNMGSGTGTVNVYSWRLRTQVGTLSGFRIPRGICVDKAQNVWVTDYSAMQIVEYAHGGTTPLQTLVFPFGGPTACSVDTVTGDIAIVSQGGGTAPAGVFVYTSPSSTPTQYTNSSFSSYVGAAYDNLGNLFVDGVGTGSSTFALAEVPSGGTTLASVSVGQSITYPSSLQWDGKYLAICDRGNSPSVVYEFSISGSAATLQGTTSLGNSSNVQQFWVPKFTSGKTNPQGTRIVAADYNNNDVPVWSYPAGGTPLRTITTGIMAPLGIAVSK
ncbi:MAG: hypothetical protein JO078_12490 [Candidatus Eremiobacteraeota bacterium]|nr:hypothetical protein [Candidatus Eremiobacteraeota bacterium]